MPRKAKTPAPPVGKRLAQARRAVGIAQAELARVIGVEKTTWNNWERGKAVPDHLVLAKVKRTYGITFEWVFDGSMVGMDHELVAKLRRIVDDDEAPSSNSA